MRSNKGAKGMVRIEKKALRKLKLYAVRMCVPMSEVVTCLVENHIKTVRKGKLK